MGNALGGVRAFEEQHTTPLREGAKVHRGQPDRAEGLPGRRVRAEPQGNADLSRDLDIGWLHRQVLTSRNIRSGRLGDFLFGGLNYQIEHHLFPAMPRVNLRRARPVVREYCAGHGIPYREEPAWRSYREVARFLGDVSRRARKE